MEMKVYGHRGASGDFPENTMLSFEEARKTGCYGIELDVHLTKDGKLVIIHDEKLERTTGMPGIVPDYTFDEITKINAGKTKDDAFGFTPIPSFEEYCEWVKKTDLVTNIEMKTGGIFYPGLEEKVIETVKRHGLQDRVVLSSFNPFSCMHAIRLAPEIPCGFLNDTFKIFNFAAMLKICGFRYYHPGFEFLTDNVANDCAKHGVGLNIWTVNDVAAIEKLKAWGTEGVITNYPGKFVSALK